MDNKEIKELLKKSYPLPDSKRREKFLRSIEKPKMPLWDIILNQLKYINIRVWIFWLIIIALGMLAAYADGAKTHPAVWSFCALIPFLAMISICEIRKSERHGMQEIEKATRFSTASVILARMLVLGAAAAVLFLALLPAVILRAGFGLVKAMVYIILPYCLSAYLNLLVSRKFRNGGIKINFAVSAAVSVLSILVEAAPGLTEPAAVRIFVPAFIVIICALTVGECKKYLILSEAKLCY